MKEKVLIVYGGKSVEHDISIITALQVMKFLPKQYDFLPIYIDKNGIWWTADNLNEIRIYSNFEKLSKRRKQVTFIMGENKVIVKKNGKFSQVFEVFSVLNCCHGNIGEDGSLQGVFKTCGIAHTSPSVVSSAICMDKVFMKDILFANDIETPKYQSIHKCAFENSKDKESKRIEEKIKYPVVVKPANLGSSIGISGCKTAQELSNALALAFQFDEKVVVEEMVENLKEFNCACFFYKGQYIVSDANEVKNKSEIYSFGDKYLSSTVENKKADKNLTKKIRALTERVYNLFECKGIVRVDFLYDEKKKILYVNEVNTIPGSLAFYLFKDIAFKELIISVIEQSKLNAEEERKLIKTFESDALNIFENAVGSSKK